MPRENTTERKAIESRAGKASPKGNNTNYQTACRSPEQQDLGHEGAKFENVDPDTVGGEAVVGLMRTA